MVYYRGIKDRNKEISKKNCELLYDCRKDMDDMAADAKRMAEIAKNAGDIIENIDQQFEHATQLDSIDVKFLLFATALQCIRQYIIGTITQRVDDKTAAKNTKNHIEEHSDRKHRLYNPSLDEIISNPVPFDVIFGGRKYGLGIGGGFTHRAKTVGHDPLLGWIFGTMNIATSTVTISEELSSYHVLTGTAANGTMRDKISMRADTFKVFSSCKDKLINEGREGKEKIGISLMKEAVHLRSDMYSKVSLPLPVISTISVDVARNLADYGFDMGNTVKIAGQAGAAILINSLIGMIHGLFYDESCQNRNLYSVKTRKILSYSNLIASASNVIAVAFGATIGILSKKPDIVKKSINYFDLGGLMVTIYRIVNDQKFICEVKQEFMRNQWYSIVMN